MRPALAALRKGDLGRRHLFSQGVLGTYSRRKAVADLHTSIYFIILHHTSQKDHDVIVSHSIVFILIPSQQIVTFLIVGITNSSDELMSFAATLDTSRVNHHSSASPIHTALGPPSAEI